MDMGSYLSRGLGEAHFIQFLSPLWEDPTECDTERDNSTRKADCDTIVLSKQSLRSME